ncbi:MAG: hypothetical protein SGJ10_07135 [Bacteroidota bacterium]|nr:hypothetical protein [Bacteroidota bacterium]
MKNNTEKKLDDALNNAEQYIEQLKAMDDKKLSKYLDLFQQQMEMAYKQKNHAAYELLCEYERQVIIARDSKY